jgi:cold shock protein
MNGIIKKLKPEGGFGFITPAEGGKDLFFHCTKVVGGPANYEALREGQEVTYNPVEGKRGLEAHDVAAV